MILNTRMMCVNRMMEYNDDASHNNQDLDDGGIAKDGWCFFLRVLASAKMVQPASLQQQL